MTTVKLGRYVAMYAGWYWGLTLAFSALMMLFPEQLSSFRSAYIGIQVGAPTFVYDRFVRNTGRLLSSSEYWRLVLICSVIAMGWECLTITLLAFGEPASSPAIFLFAGAWALAVILAANAVFYSKIIGKSFLKRATKVAEGK
jgi:hypothetical protein